MQDGERFNLHSKSYSCPDEAANAGLTEEAVSHVYHELESIRKQVKVKETAQRRLVPT